MSIFEQASRAKLRIKIENSFFTVEDLWEVDLHKLDKAYQALRKDIADSEDSLLPQKTTAKETKLKVENKLRHDIIAHIVKTLLAEAEAAKERKQLAAKRQILLEEKSRRENEKMTKVSDEELERMIADNK